MAEPTQTWVVEGATVAGVRKALAALGVDVPADKHRGRRVRVWPGTAVEPAALSRALGEARLLTLALADATLEVAVWAGGERRVHEQVPRVMKTSTVLAKTHASLQRVAAALEAAGSPPALLRDEDCAPSFLALVELPEAELAAPPPAGPARG